MFFEIPTLKRKWRSGSVSAGYGSGVDAAHCQNYCVTSIVVPN